MSYHGKKNVRPQHGHRVRPLCLSMNAPERDDWTSKRQSVNGLKQAQIVRALTPSFSFSQEDGVGKKIQQPRLVENTPAGLSMTAGGDKAASHRPSLSSLRPFLSESAVLSAQTGFIGTKAPSSEKDEMYPSWADESISQGSPEGDSSNISLNLSQDEVFSAARERVCLRLTCGPSPRPRQWWHWHLLSSRGGWCPGTLLLAFSVGMRIVCTCIVTQIYDQIVGINERGAAALHGGLKAGQVFCSINGISAAGKSIAVSKCVCKRA